MGTKYHISARIREFKIPPIHDGLVLGRESAIGCVAIRQALALLSSLPYTHIELGDAVISDIIVKESVLRRIPRDRLIEFVLGGVKPHMGATEILHIDIDAEVTIVYVPT